MMEALLLAVLDFMKIEAAKRLAIPKPPWYARSIKQVPKYNLHKLVSPFPRTELKLATKLKDFVGDDWGASWSADSSGHITIYFQTSFYESCMKAGLEWELVHAMQHEYMEAKIAIEYAREKYPDSNPYIMVERDYSLGGKAHLTVIKELDGISEDTYDEWLGKI